MSLGLWCVGVELRGGSDDEVKVKRPCRADGLGAVKDGREAWTEGPGGQVASRGG